MRPVFENFQEFVDSMYEKVDPYRKLPEEIKKEIEEIKSKMPSTKEEKKEFIQKLQKWPGIEKEMTLGDFQKFVKDLEESVKEKRTKTEEQISFIKALDKFYIEQGEKYYKELKEKAKPVIKELVDSAVKYCGPNLFAKNIINLRGNTHIQCLLKELGLLKTSKVGPLDNGITCYFNGETESALNTLIGKKFIDFAEETDINLLSDSIYNYIFGKKSSAVTQEDYDIKENIEKSRDKVLKAKKKELKPYIDAGMFIDYYNKQWSETHWRNMKLQLTGDILEDMYIFNSVKEGGLADEPKDTGPAKTPCPYGFDVSTGILTYNGNEYKLNPSKDVKNSKSVINGGTWSDRWHTSRGIVWPTWKSTANAMGITNELEIVKRYFQMSDDDVKKVYEKSFYDPYVKKSEKVTISPLVNHCMGTAAWASIGHLNKTYDRTISTLSTYGYSSIDDAINKVGEKIVTEIMLLEQMNVYKTYENFKDFGTAWTNGMLNFHRYFVPRYADLPKKEKYPVQYQKREQLGVNSYSNLENTIEKNTRS